MGMSTRTIQKVRGAALAVTLPLLLHACAQSSGGAITAYVAKGPVDNASCTLYRGDTHEHLAGPAQSEAGNVDFGNLNYYGVAYVSCTGGQYKDEFSGQESSLSNVTLRSAKFIKGAAHFVVTPITEIAVRDALDDGNGQLNQANVTQANQGVAGLFGLASTDIVSVKPANTLEEQVADTESGRYGAALAAFSGVVMGGADKVSGVLSVSNKLKALLKDWSEGPANEGFDAENFAEKLSGLTDANRTEGIVPGDVVANIIAGLGVNKDVPIGHSDTELAVLSASPRWVPMYSSPITLIGNGFSESMVIIVGDKTAADMTLDSKNKVTFTLPRLSDDETPPVGEVDVIVRHGSDVAELPGGISFGCTHSICEQPALLNGCLL